MDMIRSFRVVTIVFVLYSIKASALVNDAQVAMPCVERLLPCRPYIHSEISPPPWCCDPMKEIAEKNKTCLCEVFNHAEMLTLIDLTQENALNLLRSCGANHDLSGCSKTTVSRSTATPGSTSSGSSSASTTKNAALTISLLGFSLVSAYIVGL